MWPFGLELVVQGAPAIAAADGAYVAGNATKGIAGFRAESFDDDNKSAVPTSVAGETPATTPMRQVELFTRLKSSATSDTLEDSPTPSSPEYPLIESQWRVDPTLGPGPSPSRQLEDVSPTPAAKETHAGCEGSGTPSPPKDSEASEIPADSLTPSMAPSAVVYDKYYYQCPS